MVSFSILLVAVATTIYSAQGFLHLDEALELDYRLSTGRFGFDLYKETAKNTDNFAISPLSIHSVLTMLLPGTSEDAQNELLGGLHAKENIVEGFQQYNETLDHDKNANSTLKIANALYLRRRARVKSIYAHTLQRFFNTKVSKFANQNPHVAINRWVAKQTNDMITDYLTASEITRSTRMLLLNAVYFKAKWETPFDSKATSPSPFTDKFNKQSNIQMMKNRDKFQVLFSRELGARVLRLPYKGDRFSLNIILPIKTKTLSAVESNLSEQVIHSTLSSLKKAKTKTVLVYLPKFSLDTEAAMKKTLATLGIRKIFTPRSNSLKNLAYAQNLYVSKVKQRCIFDVNEEGTEAAAVSSAEIVNKKLKRSVKFKANRPFMFVLRDDEKNVNLFVGRYVDPKGDNLSE